MSSPVPDDPWRAERAAAEACRNSHDRGFGGSASEGKRVPLAAFAAEFYEDRLGLRPTARERSAIHDLADPDSLAIEVAHDGQLPHLGVVRMVLKANQISTFDRRAVAVYLIGDHYTPGMRPDNLHFGMPLKGTPPNMLKRPPRLRIGRANEDRPFRWLPPPSAGDLDELRLRVEKCVAENIAYERKRNQFTARDSRALIENRLRALFDLLGLAATAVRSFGDWLVRVQHDLFTQMLGDEAGRILFLPMGDLPALLREEIAAVLESASGRPEFWITCPACHRRSRAILPPDGMLAFSCNECGHRKSMSGAELWTFMVPDVVVFETGLMRVPFDGWVVGSRASYHEAIERTYARAFGAKVPPRFFLTSVPTFRGIGDAEAGYRKTRLTRALLEMEPNAVARSLMTPWDENPRLVSELLRES